MSNKKTPPKLVFKIKKQKSQLDDCTDTCGVEEGHICPACRDYGEMIAGKDGQAPLRTPEDKA